MSAQEDAQVAQQMLAAPGQGDLVDALDAVAEDVDLRSPVTRTGGGLIAQAAAWP